MKKYEIMYIVKANLEQEARTQAIEKLHEILTKNGAKIAKVDELGMKDLAYEIRKETKGYYVVIKVSAENDLAIREFNRLCKINPNVLRHLVTIDAE